MSHEYKKHVHEKGCVKVLGESSSLEVQLNAIRCSNISVMSVMCLT